MKRRVVNKADNLEDGSQSNSANKSLTQKCSNSSTSTHKKNGSSSHTAIAISILLIIIGTLIGFIIHQKQRFDATTTSLIIENKSEAQKIESNLRAQLTEVLKEDFTKKEAKLSEKVTLLTKQNEELENNYKLADQKRLDLEKSSMTGDEIEKLKHNYDTATTQVAHLKEEIQRHDLNAVLDKFGEGPHHVEFQLDFPPNEVPPGTQDSFVIEMAPLDLVSTIKFYSVEIDINV